MLIDRYLGREIARPTVALFGALLAVFIGYSAARYLGEAASDELPSSVVATLIVLKAVSSADVLLPMSLFLGIVWAVGRLHSDGEMTALAASGVSSIRVLWGVARLMLLITALVAVLSIYVRPLSYGRIYQIQNVAEEAFDFGKVHAGRFYIEEGNERVIFAEEASPPMLDRVFVQSDDDQRTRIISAHRAAQLPDSESGERFIEFYDGQLYLLDRAGQADRTIRFQRLTMQLKPKTPPRLRYKRKAQPTMALLKSPRSNKDIAEAQWRISAPVSALLLGLLGVLMSQAGPRRGRYGRVLLAVGVTALYYNLSAMAGTWVEQGKVGFFPGVFWVQGLLALVLLALWLVPRWRRRPWRS